MITDSLTNLRGARASARGLAVIAALLLALAVPGSALAQTKKKEKKAGEAEAATPAVTATPAETPAATPPPVAVTPAVPTPAATAAPVEEETPAETPAMPAYFSGTNADPKKPVWPDPTGGGAGVWVTPAGDGKGDAVQESPALQGLYDRIAHNMFSINMVWTLIAGFLVMFMQLGFAMVETGLCRSKNAGHTYAMNFMIYPLGCLAFFAYGFAIGWGNWFNGPVAPGWYSSLGPGTSVLNQGWGIGGDPATPGVFKFGIIGLKGFFLEGVDDVSVMALFFFMMVFMDTTATIPTGAMAERWAWKNFCLFGLWIALPYCLYANWVWGGGWIAQAGKNWGLGHGGVDFAGSGVVHAMGGVIALAGAKVIGPRIGKFVGGRPQGIPGHNLPMVMSGTFVLAFGWFGFNPGSTLSGTDLRISIVVVNTMLAGIAGATSAMLTLGAKGLKPDPSMLCNGMLAGLVAITAPCAFVSAWAAMVIGLFAGVFVVLAVFFWEDRGIDDPVGAVSVHGVNGLWGLISLGLFANGKYGAGWNGVVREGTATFKQYGYDGVTGLFYGDASQLGAQVLSCATVVIFGFVMAYVWFKISDKITPIRVSPEVEMQGLDIPEMGAYGYPDEYIGVGD